MPDEREPFTLLGLVNPVKGEELGNFSDSLRGEAILAEILRRPVRTFGRAKGARRSPVHRPTARRVVIPVFVAAIVSLASALYVAFDRPRQPLTIGCYASADLSSQVVVVAPDGRSPVEACAEVWRRGDLGGGPVPPLVACVVPSGVVGVFPAAGENTCAAVGARGLDPSPSPAEADATVLHQALTQRFLNEPCIDQPAATALVRRELATRGLHHWKVEPSEAFSEERPCATLGFDVPSRKVLLVPAPQR